MRAMRTIQRAKARAGVSSSVSSCIEHEARRRYGHAAPLLRSCARGMPRVNASDSGDYGIRPAAFCNARGSAYAAFTRASVLCGHPLVRDAVKHFADAVVLARLVEKEVCAERKTFRAVLR